MKKKKKADSNPNTKTKAMQSTTNYTTAPITVSSAPVSPVDALIESAPDRKRRLRLEQLAKTVCKDDYRTFAEKVGRVTGERHD